ncbi:hypothetical protein GPROT2_01146 [Gammaproteobacteria bacterium]|nr:DUF423 domain-containing protein [Gammaproteobacteria bacterium]QOJ30718.1 MAG: DUF423 domain-containing protein [Gammaproteobacteria bacterium]CAG0940912.1 hypothetical protein GPROT2_01146 [Gammaproteobacteria bacterium]
MPRLSRTLFLIAGVSLMLAAMLSAYGFHGLPGKVPEAKLASWGWATQFQIHHSIGLIIIGFMLAKAPASKLLRLAAALMMTGLVLFPGSIYATTFGAPEMLVEVAPLGGSSFMAAWLLTGIAGWRLPAA